MPGPDTKNLEEIALPVVTAAELEVAHSAGLRLPLRHYLKIFNPSDPQDTEPVTGDLVDDILDIYKAVVPPNNIYKYGHVDDALWHWNYNYKTHIGWHVTSALHTLNAYLMHKAEEFVEI